WPDNTENKWSGWPDSNRRPPDPQSGALSRLRYIPNEASLAEARRAKADGHYVLPRARLLSPNGPCSRGGRRPALWLRRRQLELPRVVLAAEQLQNRLQSLLDREQPLSRVTAEQLLHLRLVGSNRCLFFELAPRPGERQAFDDQQVLDARDLLDVGAP